MGLRGAQNSRLPLRIARAEAALPEAILWLEVQRGASKLGCDADDLYEGTLGVLESYAAWLVPDPDGTVALEPLVRAFAASEAWTSSGLFESCGRQCEKWRQPEPY